MADICVHNGHPTALLQGFRGEVGAEGGFTGVGAADEHNRSGLGDYLRDGLLPLGWNLVHRFVETPTAERLRHRSVVEREDGKMERDDPLPTARRSALRWLAAAVAVLLVAALGALLLRTALRQPSDRERILNLIADGKKAVESKDIGSTMALISPRYNDDFGNSKDDIRAYAVAYYREVSALRLKLSRPSISIKDSTALVDLDVTLEVTPKGWLTSKLISTQVTLVLEKKPARRMLIIPSAKWQVVSIRMPSLRDYEEFLPE